MNLGWLIPRRGNNNISSLNLMLERTRHYRSNGTTTSSQKVLVPMINWRTRAVSMSGEIKLIARLKKLREKALGRWIIGTSRFVMESSWDLVLPRCEREFLNEFRQHVSGEILDFLTLTVIAACPISTPLKSTGRETPMVSSKTFEGFWRTVVNATLIKFVSPVSPAARHFDITQYCCSTEGVNSCSDHF